MLLSCKWHLIEHLNKIKLCIGVTSKFTHSLFYQKVSCSFFATTCSHPFKVPVRLFKAISNEPRCPFQSLLGGHGLKSFIWQKLKEIEWNCNLALWNDRYFTAHLSFWICSHLHFLSTASFRIISNRQL